MKSIKMERKALFAACRRGMLALVMGLMTVAGWGDISGAPTNSTVRAESFYALGEHGLFLSGQPVPMVLVLFNKDQSKADINVAIQVQDFWNNVVTQQTLQVTLEPSKRTLHQLEIAPPSKLGFYCVNADVTKDGIMLASAQASFCVVHPPEERDLFFGMQNGADGRLFKAFAMMGVSSLHLAPNWRSLYQYQEAATNETINIKEKVRRHEYVNPPYRPSMDFYKAALKSDMNLVGYLKIDTPNSKEMLAVYNSRRQKGLFPYPDKMFETFGEVVEAFAEMTKDRIKLWVIQQEIDARVVDPKAPAGSAVGEMEAHVLLTRIGYDRIKKFIPDSEVAVLGICCVDYAYATPPFRLTRMILPDIKSNFDMIALDAYYGDLGNEKKPPKPPEKCGFQKMVLDTANLGAEFGKKKKVVIAETGMNIDYATPLDDPKAKIRANYTARKLIVAKSVPYIVYYNWFFDVWAELPHILASQKRTAEGDDYGLWKDVFAHDGGNHYSITGKWDHAYVPRSDIAAYATVARMLANVTEPMELKLRENVYGYVFTKKDKTVSVLYTDEKPFNVDLNLPAAAELYDLMGNATGLPQGTAKIELSASPVFLVCKAEPKQMAAAIQQIQYPSTFELVAGEAHWSDLATINVYVVNKENRPVQAELELDPMKGAELASTNLKVTLKPLDITMASVGVKSADVTRLGAEKLTMRIKAEGREVNVASDMSVLPVMKAKGRMEVNGDLTKYESIPAIVLRSPQDIYPREATMMERHLLTGADDIGVECYMCWDEQYLHLAMRVKDEKHLQRYGGQFIWKDDCLQFAFDTKNDALNPALTGKTGYDGNDYNFGVALTKDGPEGCCWVNKGTPVGLAANFPLVIKRDDLKKETIYELAISWEQLAPLVPKAGQVFGFSFVVFDSDREEEPNAAYWIGLTPGIAGGPQDPSAYKTFILLP